MASLMHLQVAEKQVALQIVIQHLELFVPVATCTGSGMGASRPSRPTFRRSC